MCWLSNLYGWPFVILVRYVASWVGGISFNDLNQLTLKLWFMLFKFWDWYFICSYWLEMFRPNRSWLAECALVECDHTVTVSSGTSWAGCCENETTLNLELSECQLCMLWLICSWGKCWYNYLIIRSSGLLSGVLSSELFFGIISSESSSGILSS